MVTKNLLSRISRVVIAALLLAIWDTQAQHNYDNQSTIYSEDGNVGIGTNDPKSKLHINGSVRGNIGAGVLRVQSDHGYLDIGARNADWGHIYTDRPKIVFNKDVYTTTNAFSSYNDDLVLKTKGTERLRIDHTHGNVGIGTTSPSHKMTIASSTSSLSAQMNIHNPDNAAGSVAGIRFNTGSGWDVMLRTKQGESWLELTDGSGGLKHRWYNEDYYAMGNVGIGTTNPGSYKLAVEGKIGAREIEVKTGSWADFVFAESYCLRSLEEVERFIGQHGHLPDVPSEDEVLEQGINLGEMDATLLQKIEELMLYTLAQQKEIEALKERNRKLIREQRDGHRSLLERIEEMESTIVPPRR